MSERGEPAKPGEIGELLVNGASAADGYWNQREKNRSTFEGAWTRTGDKYELREDGRLVYCGRTDDMFKVSGLWVAPFEVEQALVSHPHVLEAAVVPARDTDGLEKPKAFVVLKQGASREGIAETLKVSLRPVPGAARLQRSQPLSSCMKGLAQLGFGKASRKNLRSRRAIACSPIPGRATDSPILPGSLGRSIS
jgi:4-hydroxybenzoate-CoA ligase